MNQFSYTVPNLAQLIYCGCYKDEERTNYEPDSSPAAWRYLRRLSSNIIIAPKLFDNNTCDEEWMQLTGEADAKRAVGVFEWSTNRTLEQGTQDKFYND